MTNKTQTTRTSELLSTTKYTQFCKSSNKQVAVGSLSQTLQHELGKKKWIKMWALTGIWDGWAAELPGGGGKQAPT
ncbi:hypothetical protein J6590_001179 [Homalodisca vitripennis]|nr:hypothetical protein J6590_001179 [Homalodisca vitripennis]